MLHFFRGIGLAFQSYIKSFRIIAECRLGWVFIFPILIMVINLLIGGNIASHFTTAISDWIREIMPLSTGNSWWAIILRSFTSVIIWLSLFFVLVYIGGFILLILLSPILVYTSEKVDMHLTGKTYPFKFGEFAHDVLRGVGIAFRNLLIEIASTIMLIGVGLIPLAGLLVPPYLMGLAAYFYGFSFMDFTLERRRYNIRQSVDMVRKNRGTAIGLGFTYMVLTTIPFIGFALAGFASILSTVAATIATNELLEKERIAQ